MKYLIAILSLALFAGCAGVASNTYIPASLNEDAETLLLSATVDCNTGDAGKYRINMQICSDVGLYVNSLPGNMYASPTVETQAVDLACVAGGYDNPKMPAAKTVEVGGCANQKTADKKNAALAHFPAVIPSD